ncbi:hypothetical protein SBDP1_1750009 [Syntrophobacter sp. SbD1]|nr:hypothetical protein SBDP1_1750009 [Syntrophobacter sp. SbD1]
MRCGGFAGRFPQDSKKEEDVFLAVYECNSIKEIKNIQFWQNPFRGSGL